jgi:hypothetical protein
MPAFLATMGVAAAWIGLIEGISDGLSSFAKLASGQWTDLLARRKPVGFVVTGVGALLIRIIAMRFDAYLDKGPRRFSKAV